MRLGNTIIFVASLVSILPLIGGMFPYGFPIFSPMALVFACAIFIRRKGRIEHGQWMFPYFILTFFYILSLIISGNIYSSNYYDLINIVIFFCFFTGLTMAIQSREDFEQYIFYFQFLAAIFSSLNTNRYR